jgi:hypothetical protein
MDGFAWRRVLLGQECAVQAERTAIIEIGKLVLVQPVGFPELTFQTVALNSGSQAFTNNKSYETAFIFIRIHPKPEINRGGVKRSRFGGKKSLKVGSAPQDFGSR